MKIERLPLVVALGCALWACSCTLLQTPTAVAPIGPEPGSRPTLATAGFLKVYTDVECYPYDEDQYYYAHTDYGIYTPDGKRVKSVQNAESFHSLPPKQVALPPGQYTVVGWSDAYQRVKVPVVIQAGCLTTVNLEKDAHMLFQNAKPADLVHTPDGRIVGWAANVATTR